ncbi:MAG: Holliday junction resolvase RuvX [Gammaproteobacteria bacterium]|nr:Holliday junction resolvase RuvX [Gammaproteobacteria bacterium]
MRRSFFRCPPNSAGGVPPSSSALPSTRFPVTSATRDRGRITTLLAFDFGERRIGVAVGQTISASARPLGVVTARAGKPDWTKLDRLIAEWAPDLLLVGLPRHLDGTEHELAARVTKFANRMRQRYRLPLQFVDERLTSYEATQRALPGEALDPYAAQVILESWLHDNGECA